MWSGSSEGWVLSKLQSRVVRLMLGCNESLKTGLESVVHWCLIIECESARPTEDSGEYSALY